MKTFLGSDCSTCFLSKRELRLLAYQRPMALPRRPSGWRCLLEFWELSDILGFFNFKRAVVPFLKSLVEMWVRIFDLLGYKNRVEFVNF